MHKIKIVEVKYGISERIYLIKRITNLRATILESPFKFPNFGITSANQKKLTHFCSAY